MMWFICQKKYAREILKKFQMEDCKAMNTLMNQKEKPIKEDGATKVDEAHFTALVGCLMYLTTTRPDILSLVSILSRFMHCVSETHLRTAKRVVRYIKGTITFGVKFKKCSDFNLFGFSDSDLGGSVDDMKSTSRHCFSLGSALFFIELQETGDCSTINCRSKVRGSNFSSKSSHMAKKNYE